MGWLIIKEGRKGERGLLVPIFASSATTLTAIGRVIVMPIPYVIYIVYNYLIYLNQFPSICYHIWGGLDWLWGSSVNILTTASPLIAATTGFLMDRIYNHENDDWLRIRYYWRIPTNTFVSYLQWKILSVAIPPISL